MSEESSNSSMSSFSVFGTQSMSSSGLGFISDEKLDLGVDFLLLGLSLFSKITGVLTHLGWMFFCLTRVEDRVVCRFDGREASTLIRFDIVVSFDFFLATG